MARNKRFLLNTALAILFGFMPQGSFAQTADEIMHQAEAAIRQRNYTAAADILAHVSLSENAKAYYLLATLYRSGRGVSRDDKKAFELMYTAANLGLVVAQFSLAKLYLSGRGTDVDRDEAMLWVVLAAEAGHLKATRLLANLIQTANAEKKPYVPQGADHRNPQSRVPKTQRSDMSERLGWTLLIEAARRGLTPMLKQLISVGAQLDAQDNQGRTAMMHAALSGTQKTLVLLIEAGAKTDIQDNNGNTAVSYAANADNITGLKLLLSVEPRTPVTNANVMKSLERAMIAGRSNAALELMRYVTFPLDITQQELLLSYAVRKCTVTVLNEVFAKGFSPDLIDSAGRNLVWHAAAVGNAANVSYLIRLGVSVEQVDKQGISPLMVALSTDYFDLAVTILGAGSQPNARSKSGNTALLIAARKSSLEMVTALLDAGADINHRNNLGYSALMLAAQTGHKEIFSTLLEAGADAGLRNKKRERAHDIAIAAGYPDIMNLLD